MSVFVILCLLNSEERQHAVEVYICISGMLQRCRWRNAQADTDHTFTKQTLQAIKEEDA